MDPKPWLIYALGGGWGHLTRGLALARLAARQRPVHLLVNSPYVDQVHWDEPKLTLRRGGTELNSTRAWVQAIFRERDWGAWIIDTFPRGLGGELAPLLEAALAATPRHRQRCVLIHRDLNPDYVRAKQLNTFVDRHYGLVLVPGDREATSLTPATSLQRTPPWRIRNAAELPHPEDIRAQLSLPNAPLVLVCATGNADEQHHFGDLTATLATHLAQSSLWSEGGLPEGALPKGAIRCLAPTCPPGCPKALWLSHWPALDCLSLAQVVVGAAGYNLVQECEAVEVPLVAFAFRRRYDRQYLRVQEESIKLHRRITFVRDNQEAVAAVLRQLQPTITRASHPVSQFESTRIASSFHIPVYVNGAAIALDKILQQLQSENLI